MIKSKKQKLYQFGGQLYDLIPKLDKFEYTPWYAKKDTNAITNIVGSLQNIYEDRLNKRQAAVKAINDLELNPMYSGLKKDMLQSLTSGLKDLQDKSGNDITSDIYTKGMLDIVGNVMGDTRLNFAKENTKSYDTWKQNVDALSKEGKYNPMFDPNLSILEGMKSGKDLYNWWDVKTITPFFDYNDKLVKIAQQVKERSKVEVIPINDYDWWVTKLTTVPKDEISSFLQAQKEGFMASPEGQTFQLVTAKKYNLKLDSNGVPIKDDNFNSIVTKEYVNLVQGIAQGVSYTSVDDKKIITSEGQLSIDTKNSSSSDSSSSNTPKDETYGLFEPGTPGATTASGVLPQYMLSGANREFDYKSSYNTAYVNYDTQYKAFKNSYQNYEFTTSDNKKLNIDELLDYYESSTNSNDRLNGLVIKSNNTLITADSKSDLLKSLNNVAQAKSNVKAEAQYINEIDKELKSNILSVKDTFNGTTKYSLSPNYKEEVTLSNGQKVKITGKIEHNGEVLFFVDDDDKGYKSKILTPFEFKQMYNTLPSGMTTAAGEKIVELETKINDMLKDNAFEYAKGLPEFQNATELTPEMYLAFRQSDEYLNNITHLKNDILKLGGGLYSDYMAQRANSINMKNTRTYISDNYYVLPQLGEGERFDDLKADVASITNEKNRNMYYVIDEKSDKPLLPKKWDDVQQDLKNLPLVDYSFFRIFKNDVYARGSNLKIIGYDMNERLGGVYIAKVGISDSELRQLTGSETSENEVYTDCIESLRKAQNDGIMEYDQNDKMWTYKNKTLIIPNNTVAYHYFDVKSSDNQVNSNIGVYNQIKDQFNAGKEVVSLPTADNKVNTVRILPNNEFLYSFTDTDGSIQTKSFSSIESVTIFHNSVNSYIHATTGNMNKSVIKNGGHNLGVLGTNVVNNITNSIVGKYVRDYRANNYDDYNKIVRNDKNTDKLHINIVAENKFSIKYDINNLASRSLLNILRQVACIDKIDSYNTVIYNSLYNSLNTSERNDMSNLSYAIPGINMNNPAQLNMLNQLFGTQNLTINYPDNGNPNEISITINQ